MRKKLLSLAVLLFSEAIWLFPYSMMRPGDWGAIAVLAAAEACMCLLPQGWATVAVSFLAAPVFFLLGAEYFAAYAAGVFVCAALRAALSDKRSLPLRRDALVTVPLAAALVSVAVSTYFVFFVWKNSLFSLADSARPLIFVGLAAVFTAVLLAAAAGVKAGRRSGGASARVSGKLAAVLGVMLVVYASAVLTYLRLHQANSSGLLAVFLCIFTAVTVPNPATDRLLNRSDA